MLSVSEGSRGNVDGRFGGIKMVFIQACDSSMAFTLEFPVIDSAVGVYMKTLRID